MSSHLCETFQRQARGGLYVILDKGEGGRSLKF